MRFCSRGSLRELIFVCASGLWIFATSGKSWGGTLHRVGPGHPHQQIQSAVSVARNGDLILVDPQAGSYAPFIIERKQIAIASSQGSAVRIRVSNASNQAAIEVRNLAEDQSVTLYDFEILSQPSRVPSVWFRHNAGVVRMKNFEILQRSRVLDGPEAYLAAQTSRVWLSEGRVQIMGAHDYAGRVSHAMMFSDSHVLYQSVHAKGANASNGDGGHGILSQDSSVVAFGLRYGSPSALGGDGSRLGGDGIHNERSSIQSCAWDPGFIYLAGRGQLHNGFNYWLLGSMQQSPGLSPRVAPCLFDVGVAYVESEDRVSAGSSMSVVLKSTVPDVYYRQGAYYFAVGESGFDPHRYLFAFSEFWINWRRPSASVLDGFLFPGEVSASFPLPRDSDLIGYQATLQGSIEYRERHAGSPGGFRGLTVSEPAMVLVLP